MVVVVVVAAVVEGESGGGGRDLVSSQVLCPSLQDPVPFSLKVSEHAAE